MKWNDKNTNSGQLVASQTTSGDFKDLQIITSLDESWALVSLHDGLSHIFDTKETLIEWLNNHHHTHITKILGSGASPEDRANLPLVRITGLRGYR